MLCNFLVRTLQYKTDLKSSILMAWRLGSFFSAAPTAQNRPELSIRFIDSGIQWTVVLYLGLLFNLAIETDMEYNDPIPAL